MALGFVAFSRFSITNSLLRVSTIHIVQMPEPLRPGAEQGGDHAAAERGAGGADLGVRRAAGAALPPPALRQLRIQQEAWKGGP